MEIHPPTLTEHLSNQRILVFAWEAEPLIAPKQILGWARLVYAVLAGADQGLIKLGHAHTPLLQDPYFIIEALKQTILENQDHSFTPIWGADSRLLNSLARVGRELRLPALPEPETTLEDAVRMPSGSTWLGPAWGIIAKENPSFWRTFRQNLLLIPGPSIAYNPHWDARDAILSNIPDIENGTLHFLKLAGVV